MASKAAAAAAPTVSIEDLFTSLNRHIQRSEFHLVVRVSDQVLSIAPGDEDAILCKVVALIKDDKINDALSAIENSLNTSAASLNYAPTLSANPPPLSHNRNAYLNPRLQPPPLTASAAEMNKVVEIMQRSKK